MQSNADAHKLIQLVLMRVEVVGCGTNDYASVSISVSVEGENALTDGLAMTLAGTLWSNIWFCDISCTLRIAAHIPPIDHTYTRHIV